MEMNEFAEKVRKAMVEVLGDGYEVKLQEVQKNNGVRLQGLLILTEKQNVSPTIYLKPFWEAYEGGVTLADLIKKILQIYREDTPGECVDMSFFRDFEKVKDRICYRLIDAGQNRELLEKIPHIPFLDLAICFYYAYEGNALGSGSILIYHTHRLLWQTDVTELMSLAQTNTERLFPWECQSMESVLKEIMEQEQQEGCVPEEEERQQLHEEIPMHILSNRQRVYGAACILYHGVLKELAEKSGANLYILPSSVHEVILLPDHHTEDTQQLKNMIYEVNRTQLEPEEVLSDSLYYFDRLEQNVRII
ncbi:MAG: hypothetical protein E7291_01390 [Lachnospiraceae bacterium]|nr:hypothetical protein [Lachnospiraceae bacterium]